LASGDTLTGNLVRDPGETVGTYAIKQGTLANANYSITYVGDNLTITQTAITVTADPQTKAYGTVTDPALTYKITAGALASGDTLTGNLVRDPGETVGTYAIKQGTLANANYSITYVGDNLTITQTAITVTADPQTKAYGTVTDPALTYKITAGALASGDTLTGNLVRDPGETVGTYAIKQGTLANANYSITYVGDNLTITQTAITVTADPQTKAYGTVTDPALTYKITAGALASGDTLTGNLFVTRRDRRHLRHQTRHLGQRQLLDHLRRRQSDDHANRDHRHRRSADQSLRHRY